MPRFHATASIVDAAAGTAKKGFHPGLDILRITACLAVITIHSASWLFSFDNKLFTTSVLFTSFSRFAVPIFFMLTGYLLLDFIFESIKSFYIKRYVRILIPFIITCILYYFTPKYNNYSIVHYFLYCFTHEVAFHLWYIYTLIGIYAILPFFIIIVQTRYALTLINIYLGIWILWYILLPTFTRVLHLESHIIFQFDYFSGYLGYVLLGWYIKHNSFLENIKNKWLFLLFVASSLSIFFSTLAYSYALNVPDKLFFGDLTPFVLIQAVAVFILLKRVKFSNYFTNFIARLTYWIYLIHLLVRSTCIYYIPKVYQPDSFLIIPSLIISTFIISIIIAVPLYMAEQFFLSSGRRFFTFIKR